MVLFFVCVLVDEFLVISILILYIVVIDEGVVLSVFIIGFWDF